MCEWWSLSRECRRHAPTVGQSGVDGFWRWPLTQSDDWCGEYSRGPSEFARGVQSRLDRSLAGIHPVEGAGQ